MAGVEVVVDEREFRAAGPAQQRKLREHAKRLREEPFLRAESRSVFVPCPTSSVWSSPKAGGPCTRWPAAPRRGRRSASSGLVTTSATSGSSGTPDGLRALKDLGLLRTQRVGGSRLLSVNLQSPLFPVLEELTSLEFLPHREAARRFARRARRVPHLRRVVLIGSATRNEAGPESDVDVAVVLRGRTPEALDAVYRLAARVQDETGLTIVPGAVEEREVETETEFAKALREREVLYERP